MELTARVGIKERQIEGRVLLPFNDRHARVWKSYPALDLKFEFNQDSLFSDTGVI